MLLVFLSVVLIPLCGWSSPLDSGLQHSADIIPRSHGVPVAPDPACNPNQRSLHTILWSCMLTTFLCTWVAVHPNIPHSKAIPWDVLKARVYIVLVGIISPEIIVLLAARQFYGVKRMIGSFRESKMRFTITRTQAHFVQMGGFMLYRATQCLGIIDSHTVYQIMAGRDFLYYADIEVRHADVTYFRFPSDEEIWDSSKGDWITKTIGAVQVSWFVFQCITRWANGLDVAELELFTFALSALHTVIYFLWWDKPVDIRFRGHIVWNPTDAQEAARKLKLHDESVPMSVIRPGGKPWWMAPTALWPNFKAIFDYFSSQYSTQPIDGMLQIFIACTELGAMENQVEIVTISSLSAILFGGIHMVAWTASFPTQTEQMVWRVCAVLTTFTPIFPLIWRVLWARDLDYVVRVRLIREPELRSLVTLRSLTYTLIPVYIVARLGLLLVAFSTLRDLSSGVLSEDRL